MITATSKRSPREPNVFTGRRRVAMALNCAAPCVGLKDVASAHKPLNWLAGLLAGLILVPMGAAADIATFQRLKSFGKPDQAGANPRGKIIIGADGALYGTTVTGGFGTVFKLNRLDGSFRVLKVFHYADGANPLGGIMQASNGALYGTTSAGGVSGYGTIFKLNPDGSGFTVLRSLQQPDGTNPSATLLEGADGALYGTAYRGGSAGYGTVFKLNRDETGFTVLKSFNRSDGANPYASLIQGNDGAIYGTTHAGGFNSIGTIFKLNPDGTGFTVLKNLDAYPSAALLQASDGALYGTTRNGGNWGDGSLFKINPDGSGFATLFHFLYRDPSGGYPEAPLLEGPDGALYGACQQGGSGRNDGTVFRLDRNSHSLTVLKGFDEFGTEGQNPSQIVQAGDGRLYGANTFASKSPVQAGTIFSLNSDGSDFKVLRVFDPYAGEGGGPLASVIQASDGLLYGTTGFGGGIDRAGGVFKLAADGTGYTELMSFSQTDGANPRAALIEASDGLLYGTTPVGGFGYGTVFRLNRAGTDFAVLRSFHPVDGAYPQAALVQGADGALYGTARAGGAENYGSIFRLNLDGSAFNLLKSFSYTDGASPAAGLIVGADGFLYGSTEYGGGLQNGTLFKLNPSGTSFSTLKNFDFSGGGGTPNGLLQGTDGTLYGTLQSGNAAGNVFKMNPDGSGYAVMKMFSGFDGAFPYASLIRGTDGFLYGTTRGGGAAGGGTVFRIQPDGTGFDTVWSFNPYDGNGANVFSAVTQGADGAIYGTTGSGGELNIGTVFRLVIRAKTPAEQLDELVSQVQRISAPTSVKHSLVAVLQAAQVAIERANTSAACATLRAFSTQLTNRSDRRIPAEQASELISAASRITSALGCGN